MQHVPALITLVACVALAGAQPEDPEPMLTPPDSVRLPGSPAEVAMDMSFGKPAVEVMIDGRGPFKLLVDTGASPTLILNNDLADELGLEPVGKSAVGDPTNPRAIEVERVRVASVELGGATFGGIEAISWDRSTMYSGEGTPRGIIGFPLFRDVLVTFDYPGGVMRVEGGELEAGQHVIEYDDGRMGVPEIPFEVGGLSLVAHLDSGSMGAVVLPKQLADGLDLAGEPREIARARTANSEFPIYAADYGGSIKLAGHDIRTEQLMFNEVIPDPNIGSHVLAQFAVTFDQQHKLVRFARSDEGRATVSRQRGGLGIMLGRRGEDLVVSGTVPESPASVAGLREGDVLVAVNGKTVRGLPSGDLAVEMRKPAVELTVNRDGRPHTVTLTRDDG